MKQIRSFRYKLRGVERSWQPVRIDGERVLCEADNGAKALFDPRHLQRLLGLSQLQALLAGGEDVAKVSS